MQITMKCAEMLSVKIYCILQFISSCFKTRFLLHNQLLIIININNTYKESPLYNEAEWQCDNFEKEECFIFNVLLAQMKKWATERGILSTKGRIIRLQSAILKRNKCWLSKWFFRGIFLKKILAWDISKTTNHGACVQKYPFAYGCLWAHQTFQCVLLWMDLGQK